MITLYGKYPTRSNRVQWALEELEVPYTFSEIDFAAGDTASDAFKHLNPAGKIPVLQDDDLVITESGAICTYLGDKFPESELTPTTGTRERAKYNQWMIFVQAELEQPMWTKAKHKFALPKERRVGGLDDTVSWEFARAADLLSTGLGDNEFLVGDRFTMADIMASHTLGWAKIAHFDIDHENLSNYLERNVSRPAYGRMATKETVAFGS